MEAETAFYERAIARVYRWIIIAAAVGTIAALAWRGWETAVPFALAAMASYFSFKWLHEVVDALGPDARPGKRVFVLAGLRYALIGLGAYVIVKVFGMSGLAAVMGLFVAVVAVIAEIIFELANGT
ncbi:MAG TPA: hypothetical protein VN428_14470 [Bryobacteraceae bacterium]|nr:hypothetical protein [Bryobacteraceae bacterium]